MRSVDDGDRADDFLALAELAEAFSSLVEALHEDELVVLSPTRVVVVGAACMPRSQHAALTTLDHGVVRTLATTSDMPARVDAIREQSLEGPALDVLDTNDLVVSGDLADDPRWPRFGSRVTDETSIRSIVSYRLYLSREHRAALTFYSDWPHAFDDLAIAMGAIFAAYGSLTLTNELVLTEPVAVRRSADVHREIGVAVGLLMSMKDLSTQAAFERLHRASRELNRSLPSVARHVIDHRRLPQVDPG
jgi:hypothetical protein